jgi:hypothetical protein
MRWKETVASVQTGRYHSVEVDDVLIAVTEVNKYTMYVLFT